MIPSEPNFMINKASRREYKVINVFGNLPIINVSLHFEKF